MGKTIATAKHAGAFVAPNGETGYVLLQDMGCGRPFTGTSPFCAGAGYLSDVVRDIFSRTAEVACQQVQGRNGPLNPISYVGKWYGALSRPFALPDRGLPLRKSNWWGERLTDAQIRTVEATIRAEGSHELADSYRDQSQIELRLHAHFDIYVALRRIGLDIAFQATAWHTMFPTTNAKPSLAYRLKPARHPKVNYPVVYKIDHAEGYYLTSLDGLVFSPPMRRAAVLTEFISNFASTEINYPGSFAGALRAMHDRLEQALAIPAAMQIRIYQELLLDCQHTQNETVINLIRGAGASSDSATLGQLRGAFGSDVEKTLSETRFLDAIKWTMPRVQPDSPAHVPLTGELACA